MDEQDNKRLGVLIKRLASGDASALGEIAALTERILKAIGNTYYRNRADVEDAISNLYVKLYDNAKKFHSNTNACAWIIRVFENNIKSDLRAICVEREFLKENSCYLTCENTIDEKYIENHLFVREIVDKLTQEEWRLLVYYYWSKCSIREMAGIFHKPKSTIDRKLKQLEEKIKNF